MTHYPAVLLLFFLFLIVFSVSIFLYAIRKIKKVKGDFEQRLQQSTVEADQQIYCTFIKRYAFIIRFLIICTVLVPVMVLTLPWLIETFFY
ncbi:MAG: hypothetical protein KBB54_03980 [Candidatus Pacebacteria bacterium]|jgi:uncharacterized membrane protein|nr:hypothetical protein [Candidatus Paceibacterota bacterium]MBP9700904.1 hypothetical protein [Candidatus Paceibacterota bacterium]